MMPSEIYGSSREVLCCQGRALSLVVDDRNSEHLGARLRQSQWKVWKYTRDGESPHRIMSVWESSYGRGDDSCLTNVASQKSGAKTARIKTMSIACVWVSLKVHSTRVGMEFLPKGGQQLQKNTKNDSLLKATSSLNKVAQIPPHRTMTLSILSSTQVRIVKIMTHELQVSIGI